MAAFLLPLLAGAALGGSGSMSQNATLTGTNSLQSNITPNTVISIGGAVESSPRAPYFGNSEARGQGAIATPEQQNPLGGFPAIGGTVPQTYAPPVASSGGNIITDNLPILLIGAAAVYFLTKG